MFTSSLVSISTFTGSMQGRPKGNCLGEYDLSPAQYGVLTDLEVRDVKILP